jgi:hypothetical protein
MPYLSEADRARAAELSARPTVSSEQIQCSATFCIHWNPGQVSSADTNPANGVSDYIDLVAQTVGFVQNTYLGAGYRAVESDGTAGGSPLPDIYIDDIGPQGLYGYCNSDDFPSSPPWDTSAFCVLDNDYSPAEFPTNTPSENLQVTVAHEYFHAVQFAYDRGEDSWFMEATATWAEDEVFTDVNDNMNYLGTGAEQQAQEPIPDSPLSRPDIPLDFFDSQGSHQYGDWIFFRYLTEKFPSAQGGIPSLILKMWQKADGSAVGPDQHSAQAIDTVLKAQGSSFAKEFAKFSDANRRPSAVYSEGAANDYPTAPTRKFSKKNGWYQIKLDHLTSATGLYRPGAGLSKLKVTVDLASKATSPSAVLSVYLRSGSVSTSFISLDNTGAGSKVVPFSKSKVNRVEVTLVNGSTRFSCWHGTPLSCQGVPVDDQLTAKVKAAAK